MVRLVRAEKMVLSGLVFARKIARIILIKNIQVQVVTQVGVKGLRPRQVEWGFLSRSHDEIDAVFL